MKTEDLMSHLKTLSLKMGCISTINELTSALEEAGSAISLVSSHLDTGKLSQLSKGLAKENAKLEMKEDLLNEVLSGIGDSMGDPLQEEQLYKQVLEDVGLQVEEMVM